MEEGKGTDSLSHSPIYVPHPVTKGVMFMNIIRKPFLFGNVYILLIRTDFSLRPSYFEQQKINSTSQNISKFVSHYSSPRAGA